MSQRILLSKIIKRTMTSFERCENEVRLLGRAGSDAQAKGSFEHPVVQFTVATHSNFKYANDDLKQKTQWHKVAVFKPGLRQLAEDYVKKGVRISVKGKLEYGEITDAQGKPKQTTTIIADDIIFLTKSENRDDRDNSSINSQ